jgi:predicted ATPase
MINRIELENFKSIRKMDLQLRDINILIGANGAGKSNFISFFNLLRNIYIQNFQNYVAAQAGAENLLYFGLKNSEYLKTRIEFDKISAYFFKLMPNTMGGLFFKEEGTEFNTEFDKNSGFDNWDNKPLISAINLESAIISQNNKYGRYKYVRNYLESFRIFHFHDTSATAKIKQASDINDNTYLREDAGNLAAYLYWIQEQHPKTLQKIEQVVRSVAPYFEHFILQPNRLAPNYIHLAWKEKGSEAYFNASHFSDGTLRFIALVTLFLQPEPPKVILIDEPELGLHPFAISKLAGLIKKSAINTQVIISTQSVNLVDNFDPEHIIAVDRKDRQSVFNPQNSETLADWLQNYTMGDLWNKNIIGARP